MRMTRALVLACCLVGAAAIGLAAQEPSKQESKTTLAPIMERVKAWAADTDWRKKSFKDPALEKALKEITVRLAKATGHDRLQLPIRLAGMKSAAPHESGKGFAVVSGGERLSRAEGMLILSDGNVDFGFATDCVILAAGTVTVSQGTRNFIIAGDNIEGGIFSAGGVRRPEHPQGVAIAGRAVNISQGYDLICAAYDKATIQRADHVLFVNTPTIESRSKSGCRELKDDQLDLHWKD